jgi:hypothetical protein
MAQAAHVWQSSALAGWEPETLEATMIGPVG